MSTDNTDVSESGFMVFSASTTPTATQVDAYLAQAQGEFELDAGVTYSGSDDSHVRAVILKTKIKVIELWRSLNLFATNSNNGAGDNKSWSPQDIQNLYNEYWRVICLIAPDSKVFHGSFSYGW